MARAATIPRLRVGNNRECGTRKPAALGVAGGEDATWPRRKCSRALSPWSSAGFHDLIACIAGVSACHPRNPVGIRSNHPWKRGQGCHKGSVLRGRFRGQLLQLDSTQSRSEYRCPTVVSAVSYSRRAHEVAARTASEVVAIKMMR